jgi:hypothetical protein
VIGLLRAFPEEIEADLARFYPGRDIAQFWRGEMTGRALAVLIRHLPEDAALVKAQRGTHWSELMYLVAHIADTVAYARADYANAHGGSASPEPVPRPDSPDAEEDRQRVRHLHDALTDMMHGRPALELAAGPDDTA